MGVTGRDVQLSEAALQVFPYAVECKSRASIALYKDYEQACENAGSDTPLLVIKQNQSKPLVVIDMEDFFRLINVHQKST
jgi:hypothetical protein